MHTSSAHASTCGVDGRLAATTRRAVRSARRRLRRRASRTPSTASWSPCRTPNGTRACRDSSASISHDHATSASSGSTPMSGSSGACAKHTMRHAPFHGVGSSGSCSRMNRPVPYGGVHALGLGAHVARRGRCTSGASPVGAAISRTDRSLAERRWLARPRPHARTTPAPSGDDGQPRGQTRVRPRWSPPGAPRCAAPSPALVAGVRAALTVVSAGAGRRALGARRSHRCAWPGAS